MGYHPEKISLVNKGRVVAIALPSAQCGYTGWFTEQHFADSIGWPLALTAFGMFMIGLSALAFRFDRDYVRQQ